MTHKKLLKRPTKNWHSNTILIVAEWTKRLLSKSSKKSQKLIKFLATPIDENNMTIKISLDLIILTSWMKEIFFLSLTQWVFLMTCWRTLWKMMTFLARIHSQEALEILQVFQVLEILEISKAAMEIVSQAKQS